MIIGRSANDYMSVCSDCLICNRKIVLSLTHSIKETILCDECKKRLKELLYNIGELEESD